MISILEEKYPLPDLTEIDPSVMGGPAYSEEPEITAYLYQNEKENRGSAWSWIAIAAGLAVLAAGAVILVRKKHIR